MSYKQKLSAYTKSKTSINGNFTVLVVEDDLLTRSAISEALRLSGFVTLEAYTACHAIEILKYQHVDVLFADLNLPSEDEGLLTALYAQLQRPGVDVILTSARRRDRDAFLEDYFGPFVPKPYLLSKVIHMIGECVSKRRAKPKVTSHPNPLPPVLWE